MKMKKYLKLVCGSALTAAAVLALAACGSKEAEQGTAASSPSEAAPAVEQVFHITQRLGNGGMIPLTL